MTVPEPPDRATVLAAVMPALLATQASVSLSEADSGATGSDTVVATRERVVAGTFVAREAFARLGVRFRPSVDEGARVAPGDVIGEVGGPVAAIGRAAPVAIGFLDRLSAVASGVRGDHDDPLEAYAASIATDRSDVARLSSSAPVDDDGPSFRLGSEG